MLNTNNKDGQVIDTPLEVPPPGIPVSVESVEVSSSPGWVFGGSEPTASKETVLTKKTKKKGKRTADSDSPFKFL